MTSVVFTPALESIDGVDVELAGDLAGMQFYVMSWLHRISEKGWQCCSLPRGAP